jgi:TRAP-type C4-dicarboxylate transport system permease small subunit
VKYIVILAKLCSILAGTLLTAITLVTCYNLVLRNLTTDSIPGAFEVTAFATGAAIAMFMPLSQVRHGHIIVDFFTAKCSDSFNDKLDRFGALMLAVSFALLAWRTTLGGINVYQAHSESQMMGVPEWYVYAAMVPPFALTAVIGLLQAIFGFHAVKEH